MLEIGLRIFLAAVLVASAGAAAAQSPPAAPTPIPMPPPAVGKNGGAPAAAKAGASPPQQAATGTQSSGASPQSPAVPVPVPAKELFGAVKTPTKLAARAIGGYAKGCLAGARSIAIDGPAWQVMRLSRNRNWGHPDLVKAVERLATNAQKLDGWPGLLVGDISQPRGGPMLTGHASHQIGLDADIWLTPMPPRRLSPKEREDLAATSMVAEDRISVDGKAWTPGHVALVKRAASDPDIERVLVHPAIKKALCDASQKDPQRAWLGKVRPYWGHEYHMHLRLRCPASSPGCTPQPPVGGEDGCGKEVADWLKLVSRPPAPPVKPEPPKPPMTLAQLPPDCRLVLAGAPVPARPLVRGRKAPHDTAAHADQKK